MPLVLFAFSYRTIALGDVGCVQAIMMAVVTAILLGLQIRRCSPARRRDFWPGFGHRVLWVVETFLLLVIIAQAVRLPAPLLGTVRAWFSNEGLNFSSEEQKEELQGADPRRTYLKEANLQGANLVGTNFAGAILQGSP